MNKIASKLPLCYHPTTIIMVDDNTEYLNQLKFKLMNWFWIVKNFDSPYGMLEFINDEYRPDYWSSRLLKEEQNINHKYQQWAINVNLYELPLEIYNINRFNQVSCVISDYSMPGMNGLELLQAIRQPFIKKILLTGIADEQIAIEAFNKGEIDAFILKSDFNMFEKLYDAICQLSQAYFNDLSQTTNSIININRPKLSLLNESAFYKHVQQIIKKYKIVEYYMFESCGCYIMVDSDAKTYGLFVYSEEDALSVLDDIDNQDKLLDLSDETPQIMCYYNSQNLQFPESRDKYKYLQPAQVFVCNAVKYYWAITEYNLNMADNILSLNSYKRL